MKSIKCCMCKRATFGIGWILFLCWIYATESTEIIALENNSTNNTDNENGFSSDCRKNRFTPLCPEGTRYDETLERCVSQWIKKNFKRQTAIVGMICQENIDCQTSSGGAYCDSTKRCDCLPAYVNINGYCWQKRNPGESCTYQEQCTSVTPNSYCAQDGTCQCTNNQPPYLTVDGTFCILPGECPTNGPNSRLRDPTTGTIKPCDGGEARGCLASDSSDGSIASEVYNCLCATPIPGANPEVACLNDVGNSYCCPVRAIACIQPRDEGSGILASGLAAQRWWYNSATDTCEAFSFRGSGGNANNFETKALCESYCRTVCPRGKPTTDIIGGDTLQYTRCSATTPCTTPNYYCHTEGRGVYSLCCPNKAFVCGARGGISDIIPGSPQMPGLGDSTYNGRAVNRFYYDETSQQCLPFQYNGLAGTFNNFQTETECRSFCASTVCGTVGEPLRDSGGATMRCGTGGTSVCPSKYTCVAAGYCCPTVDFVCTQPQAVGGCSHFVERWWFNQVTRSCERFSYSGCQGNFNNFQTYQECTNYCTASAAKPRCPQGEAARESGGTSYIVCSGTAATVTPCPADYYCYYDGTRYGCCPTRTKTCSVDQKDQGTACVTPVTRWYYNSQTRLCDIFTYNGCDGNSNNFPTKVDCQDYCGVGGCPEGGEPLRESYNGQYRVCGTGGTECTSGYTCSVVSLGTTNRYNYCCPTRAYICALSQDAGQVCGISTMTRYYFNIASRTCESFTYNGCGGNRNNFATLDQCLNYCNSAGCPAGTIALHDATIKSVTPCDTNSPTSCPTGHTCIFSTTLQQGVCCGSTAPQGSCPPGQIAYMDSLTTAPLQCQPNVAGSCPNGIFCQYSYNLQNSFCCSSRAIQCPQGGEPYMDPVTSQARQCTPGLLDVCPSGYNCQSTTIVVGNVPSATGYCCGLPNVCGSGYAPLYVHNRAVSCTVTMVPSPCQPPFTCRLNPSTQLSYCCVASTNLTPVCAVGKEPYMVQGSPSLCTQGSASTACPAGYTCDLYSQTGSYYCCRAASAAVVAGGCPAPYILLQPVTVCSPGVANACPINYFCMLESGGSRYVCCGSGTAAVVTVNPCAPTNGQPYINPANQQPQLCVLGAAQTGCPVGYICAYSATMQNYYCCSGRGVINQCPSGFTTAFSVSGVPQQCVLGSSTCPPGSSCTRTATGTGLCCRRIGGTANTYGCPVGNAYLYPGTQTPLACTRTGPACPVGYTCRHSIRVNAWYCCSNAVNAKREQIGGIPEPKSKVTNVKTAKLEQNG